MINLADMARERQHKSSTDIIASLTDGDRRLRALRDLVDRAFELRAAAASIEIERLNAAAPPLVLEDDGVGIAEAWVSAGVAGAQTKAERFQEFFQPLMALARAS